MEGLDATVTSAAKLPEFGKSFAQALSGNFSGDSVMANLPSKVVIGDSVRVKISHVAYEAGITACRFNLHGRLTLQKGTIPFTTLALKAKLQHLWPQLKNWNIIPLGKGFFEFNFQSLEDMKKIWSIGAVNLQPGLMRFFCWTKDFTPKAQAQTHTQIWVRLIQLPQEYWGKQTIYEITSGLGTPLTIDEATQCRRFGLFVRVLVDVNLSDKLFESVIIEREGHALTIAVQYEKLPSFCVHCKSIGHSVQFCSKMNTDAHSKQMHQIQRCPT